MALHAGATCRAAGNSNRGPQSAKLGETLITLEGVGRTHDGQRQLFSDVTLTLRRGERLAVVGANGCGKTTLLRVIAGARRPFFSYIFNAAMLNITCSCAAWCNPCMAGRPGT